MPFFSHILERGGFIQISWTDEDHTDIFWVVSFISPLLTQGAILKKAFTTEKQRIGTMPSCWDNRIKRVISVHCEGPLGDDVLLRVLVPEAKAQVRARDQKFLNSKIMSENE